MLLGGFNFGLVLYKRFVNRKSLIVRRALRTELTKVLTYPTPAHRPGLHSWVDGLEERSS